MCVCVCVCVHAFSLCPLFHYALHDFVKKITLKNVFAFSFLFIYP